MPAYSFYNSYTDEGKTSLTKIIFPESMTAIGIRACWKCSGLIEIKLFNDLKVIKDGALGYLESLESLTIPNSVESIGSSSFYVLRNLTRLSIPNSVKTMGDFAFGYAYNLETLTIGSSISSIPSSCFTDARKLSEIYSLNPTPPTFGNEVFRDCSLISYIYVPASAVNAYKGAQGWGDAYYNKIYAMESSNTFDILVNYNTGGIVKDGEITIASGAVATLESETTKTFTIEPIGGYEVSTLTYNEEDVLSQLIDNQYTTGKVNADAELSITFTKIQYELTINSAENGSVVLFCEYSDSPSFKIVSEEGWRLHSVYYNEIDVTNDVVDGVYSVPAIIENGTLNISFVTDESTLAPQLKSTGNIRVYNSSYGIVVEGLSNGENVELYNINGVLLESQISQGNRLLFSVPKNIIYLVRISNKTFKVIH